MEINESEPEEEIIVFAEIQENVNIGNPNNIHVLGINDQHPIIQIGDSFFRGTFQSPLGTYMFFGEDLDPKSEDPLFDKLADKNLKYLMKTDKYLHMEHAHVIARDSTESNESGQHSAENNIETAQFTTVQEALDKLKTDWLPEISQELISKSLPKLT